MERWGSGMRRVLIAAVATALISTSLMGRASATITPVQLGTGTLVEGLSSFYRMAVGAGLVFLAEGPSGSAVAVMNMDGTQADLISNIPGPVGVAVAGTTLYVAAENASAIYVYDVSSMPATQTATHSTLPVASPTSMALSGGRLWYTGLDADSGPHASIGSMKTNGTDVRSYYPPNYEYWQYFGGCGDIDQSASAPNRIFLHGLGCGEPDAVYLYDSSGTSPSRLADYGLDDWGSYYSQQVGVLPDGSGMLVQYNDGLAVRSLDSLAGPTFSYQAPSGWDVGYSVATGHPNLIAASGYADGSSAILVWHQGHVLPVNAFVLPTGQGTGSSGTVAFSADGSRLFVAAEGRHGVYFHAIDPTAQGTSLTLVASSARVRYPRRVTFTATLAGPGEGQSVTIDAVTGGVSTTVGTCITDGDGVCTLTTRPAASGTYSATFSGSSGWAPSSSSPVNVDVAAWVRGILHGYYGTSGAYRLYHQSRGVRYTAVVKPPYPGKRVTIFLSFNLGSGWRSGGHATFKEGRGGGVRLEFRAGFFPKGRYTLRARYDGDAHHLGAHSTRAYFQVRA